MVALDADKITLAKYQPLWDEDLKIAVAANDLNARGLQHESLAWFWSMDIPKDTKNSDWLAECMFQFKPAGLTMIGYY